MSKDQESPPKRRRCEGYAVEVREGADWKQVAHSEKLSEMDKEIRLPEFVKEHDGDTVRIVKVIQSGILKADVTTKVKVELT